MEELCMCRTCLNESNSNFISIYSDVSSDDDDLLVENENNRQIAKILDELTNNKYNTNEFPYPNKICAICVNTLKTAFEFKRQCEVAFDQLMRLNDSKLAEQNTSDDATPLFVDTKNELGCGVIEPSFCGIDVTVADIQDTDVAKETESPEIKRDEIGNGKTATTITSKAYQCDNCDRQFTRKTHLRRHMTIHTDERAFACKQCDKKFRRADHLKIHENHHAKIKPHICPHCHLSFSRAEHVRRHIMCRHMKKDSTFACLTCDFVGTTQRELNQHQKSHAEVWYPCKTCDEKFPSKPELADHVKKHASDNQKPYLCSECGLRFIRNDYLVVHMRRHTGEKPYKCKFCDRGFPRATDLTVHERYHTNEKKHVCNVCGKGFQRAYNLTVHMRVHTGEKPYECPHCKKGFSQGNDLKAHIRRHTGERYQCEYCQSSFIQLYLLKNHKKNSHGIDTASNISRVAKI